MRVHLPSARSEPIVNLGRQCVHTPIIGRPACPSNQRSDLRRYGAVILRATIETQVSPALALAILAVESAGVADAQSRAGAQGVMQLIPDTAARFNVDDPFDPAQNIRGGVAYLDFLMGRFARDPLLVIAAYNAGEGAVDTAGGVPNLAETHAYVPKVAEAWQVARLLCITPPELISDGCVFATMQP